MTCKKLLIHNPFQSASEKLPYLIFIQFLSPPPLFFLQVYIDIVLDTILIRRMKSCGSRGWQKDRNGVGEEEEEEERKREEFKNYSLYKKMELVFLSV